jgi:hypothetical protein
MLKNTVIPLEKDFLQWFWKLFLLVNIFLLAGMESDRQ